jgi:hypothetical protein
MRCLPILALLALPVLAQYPVGANALQWTGTTSTAGPFCWGFSCTPEIAMVTPGESGSLLVRAELNQLYGIGISLTATRCLSVPGISNSLVLDDPITIWRTGVCAQGSPILACPSGTDTIPVTIPSTFPSGLRFSVQAVTGTPGGPAFNAYSFTQPLTFVVL